MTRPRSVVQTSLLLIALVVVSGALIVLGCSSATKFSGVTANDLANRAYPFPMGAGAILSSAPPRGLGLPQGQAFTLQFGNFGGTSTGPVRLDSGGSTASGRVTLGTTSSTT